MDLKLNPDAIPNAPFAIAFSGGGDSTALVHALRAKNPLVLIVDHGLRAGSAEESKAAQKFAQGLGLQTKIFRWSPPPNITGVQAKARRARYGLLGAACREQGLSYLLTGHTQDDQAETVLMRLKAGGSWRGGAGMRAVTPSPLWPELAEIDICRPMMGASRGDVRHYLQRHDLPFADDPSNENRAFARIRARDELRRRPNLRRDMLSLSRDMHIGRADEMRRLEALFTLDVKADAFGNLYTSYVPPKRLLSSLIRAASGTDEQPREKALSRLSKAARHEDFRGASLGGAMIMPRKGGLIISRDPVVALGRTAIIPLAEQVLSGRTLWDGRFWIDGEGTVAPTGKSWIDAPPSLKAKLKHCPVSARAALPLWRKDRQIVAIGPYSLEGQRLVQVKSAVLPRLQREFSYINEQAD